MGSVKMSKVDKKKIKKQKKIIRNIGIVFSLYCFQLY